MTTWEQTFINFLQKHDALEQYIKNLNSLKPVGDMSSILNYPKAFLTSSFPFNGTPEGVDFWMELQREWVIECGDVTYIPDDKLEYISEE